MAINQKLIDRIIKFQIDLRKLESGQKRKAINILKDVEKFIVSQLSEGEVVDFSKKKIELLINSLRDPVSVGYKSIEDQTQEVLDGITLIQVSDAGKALSSVVINATVALPVDSVIDRLSKPLLQGALFKDWIAKQEADTIFKLGAAIREGVLLGETNGQIISRFRDTMEISRKSAASLIQTSVAQVNNDARQSVYEANADIIDSFEWFPTFDSHTCPKCIARSGLKWKNNADKTPIGHSIPFQVPPIHFNDRCVLIPDVNSDFLPDLPIGERASSLGPIKADTTFKEYLKMVDKDQVEEMLGVGRAEMFTSGKINLNQLLDSSGKELTLAELRAKYL